MTTVLIPLPSRGFDPTEAGVPWHELTKCGYRVLFATPNGQPAEADPRMLFGTGLGLLRPLLQAGRNGIAAHNAMVTSTEFRSPRSYSEASSCSFDALLLPGGHASGMREYLESNAVHALVTKAFESKLIIGAICHGVVAAARSRTIAGRSVLYGRKTTALTRDLELSGWALTALWLGNYYRTYSATVQSEVISALAHSDDFIRGPLALLRDAPDHLARGFVVRDGNYLSARWPGDAHRFATEFATMLGASSGGGESKSAA